MWIDVVLGKVTLACITATELRNTKKRDKFKRKYVKARLFQEYLNDENLRFALI